ncbi:MAG: transglutaminase domain-containing protein, partial [Candidatus Zixiibacteriota bacterium]
MSKLKPLLCLFAPLLLVGCHVKITGDTYPPKVAAVLDAAGDNRPQLEQVIEHYRRSGDTLKLKAAYFLIGNLKDKSYVTYRLFDTSGATVSLDVLAYPDYKALTHAVDSIERERGELDYEHTGETDDAKVITADYLIHNIDAAFTAWREKPWARGLTFDEFCNYVLPYRGSNEPLENWRDTFLTRYADLTAELGDSADPIAVAARINDDIKSWFTFDPRYYYHPTDQGIKEMFASGKGRCEDMTNLAIYAMRANGLAVTSDYTPYWANSGNNHAWNAIVTPDGKVVPFMGCEANPGTYHLWNKLAKVYRKTFAQQPTTLAMQPHKQDSLPRFLGGDSYLDVTADYVPTVDVTITLKKSVPDSVDIAYICVFNSGHWRPIDWGRIEGNQATFHNIGTDIMYLPALYL